MPFSMDSIGAPFASQVAIRDVARWGLGDCAAQGSDWDQDDRGSLAVYTEHFGLEFWQTHKYVYSLDSGFTFDCLDVLDVLDVLMYDVFLANRIYEPRFTSWGRATATGRINRSIDRSAASRVDWCNCE